MNDRFGGLLGCICLRGKAQRHLANEALHNWDNEGCVSTIDKWACKISIVKELAVKRQQHQSCAEGAYEWIKRLMGWHIK